MNDSENFSKNNSVEAVDEVMKTLQETLSSARLLNETMEASLTSVNMHPYEQLKRRYLGLDFVPLTLDCIPAPQTFCPMSCREQLSAISCEFNTTMLTQFTAASSEQALSECSVFAVLSATENGNEFIIDEPRVGNYLQFLEMVKSIPMQAVEKNSEEVARKLLTHYISIFKK